MAQVSISLSAAALLIDIPTGILCGIDLLSFTTSAQFRGIKDIPPGWHFIYTSETISLSIREGFWFYVSTSTNPAPLIVCRWDSSTGALEACEDDGSYGSQLCKLWEKNLSSYRQSASKEAKSESRDWAELTRHVTPNILSHFAGSKDWKISSASCANQDKDDIPGLNNEEVGAEKELGVLGIDLKRTWRVGATGRERTEGALDSSWALSDVTKTWQEENPDTEKGWQSRDVILGQMEICFIMILTVANYSCLEEWKRCVGLVLTCKRAVRDNLAWFASVLMLLKKQMERCEDVEGGLFDMSDEGGGQLRKWLKGFKMTLGQIFGEDEGDEVKEEMETLEAFLKTNYGWELGDDFVRRGVLDLEDGEQIYAELEEMEGEDERGEYAPVVVDLG